MTTARDFVTSAARTAKIIGSDEILNAGDAQSALGIFNSMLQAWPADGINYTHELIDNLDDQVNLPPAFVKGGRYLLAVDLSIDFESLMTAEALAIAERERGNLQAATNESEEVKLDRGLRRMTVNNYWRGWYY